MIGDPIPLLAEVMREPLAKVLVVVTVAKVGRYTVLVIATQSAICDGIEFLKSEAAAPVASSDVAPQLKLSSVSRIQSA
ncbi:hypothetical protein A9R05_39750 (plasmid) [Burkholderia sp. KK1]|nr:hypothetical protein A9R05_39750 [Burkholderia sp. KK1]